MVNIRSDDNVNVQNNQNLSEHMYMWNKQMNKKIK
jgi:hypothetical protein